MHKKTGLRGGREAMKDILQTLVPGGVVAAVLMLVKAWKDWRKTRDSREATLLSRYQRDNGRLRADLDFAEQECDWWRNRAGDLEHALRTAGVTVQPPSSPKPRRSERNAGQ